MSSAPMGVASPSSWCSRSASQAPPVRMPTMPVEAVTPERSLRTSSWHKPSASGRFIEITLQYDLRGERVEVLLVFARAAPRFAKRGFGRRRGQALVGLVHRQPKARLDVLRGAAGAGGTVIVCGIPQQWEADQAVEAPPF